jgi:lipoprotein NlpI
LELALANDLADAEKEFREVIRTRPGFAQAHFNLGVALARQKKFSAAAAAFQKTLELDPSNNAAREQLGIARAFLGGSPQ